jgi:hypothetical protein
MEMGTLESFAGTYNVEFQISKWLTMRDVCRRVDKKQIYKFSWYLKCHIFRKFVRNFEGYLFIPNSGEKTVELHISLVFPCRMK